MHHAPWKRTSIAALLLLTAPIAAHAADRAQWGERDSRNMVSEETGLAVSFDPGKRDRDGNIDLATTENVRWVARLGNTTYGTPVVAGGKVFIGTNNENPRDPRLQGDRGVLMCFEEKSGRFLWQLVVPRLLKVKWSDWRLIGFTSPVTVEGDRAYAVSNRCEVICVDTDGLADGNDGPFTDEARHMVPEGEAPVEPGATDGDIIWRFDMNARLNVEPHNATNSSVLVAGDYLYVNTSNGVEWTHHYVVHPEAPTVIVLNKHTGELVARDAFGIGPDVTHGQWSSVAVGRVGGRSLGFFGAGNGYLYAFGMLDPNGLTGGQSSAGLALLENVWKFHGHPLAQTQDHVPPDHQHDSTSYQVTAMPVFHRGRVYLAFTQEPYHKMKEGTLVCVDAAGTGDVTRRGIVWSYPDLGSSTSTVAIADGLVYAADFSGRLHCLDADTGEVHWVHELGGPLSASPMVADGRVYLGTCRAAFWVFEAGPKLKVLSQIRMRDKVASTATAANNTLYVATYRHLYAIERPLGSDRE